MRWEQGRSEIDRMIADGELERVQASRAHADRLIEQAERHLDSAEMTCDTDPEAAYHRWGSSCVPSIGCVGGGTGFEYPRLDTPELVAEDVRDDQPKVREILEIAVRVMDSMSVY